MAKKAKNSSKSTSPRAKRKGVGFITERLVKLNAKEYPNKKSATAKAKEIAAFYKKKGEPLTVWRIKEYLGKGGKKRKAKKGEKPPYVPSKMFEPTPYYLLNEYPVLIEEADKKARFTSDLFWRGAKPVYGGKYIDYTNYFQPFLQYANEWIAEEGDDFGGRDVAYENFFVATTEPMIDENNEWVCDIFVCDAEGNKIEDMYGFNPDGESDFENGFSEVVPVTPDVKATRKKKEEQKYKKDKKKVRDEERKESKSKKAKATKSKEAKPAKSDKAVELQIAKEKTKVLAMELLKEGLINKKEFLKMIS